MGRADSGGPQQIEQADRPSVGDRNQRAGCEILRQLLRHLAIDGLLGQRAVFEQLFEGAEGFVAVGGPEEEEFFQGSGAVGRAIRLAGEPLTRSLPASDDGGAGKLLDEGQQHGVELLFPNLGGEPGQTGGHHFGIELLAIARHEDVAGFVDEAHGVKLAGVDGAVGVALGVTHLVHAVGKLAAGSHVREDDVTRIGEEGLGELVAIARVPRNVEFHHWKSSSPPILLP